MTILVSIDTYYWGDNGEEFRNFNQKCSSIIKVIEFIAETQFQADRIVDVQFYKPLKFQDLNEIQNIITKYSNIWSKSEWNFEDRIREIEYKLKELQKQLDEQRQLLNELGISLKENFISQLKSQIEKIKLEKKEWLELKQKFNSETFDELKEKLCLDT